MTWFPNTTTICSDGTTCENSSRCLAHPTKEGSYICDCLSSPLSADDGPFAGLYCEHAATALCTNANTNHAFCTNGGECKQFVGKSALHGGCNCPKGYTGEYCQFVAGSVPSDLALVNYPALSATTSQGGMAAGRVTGIVMGVMGMVVALGMLFLFIATGKFVVKLPRFGDKEMDSNTNENDDFIGGKSVYIKRRSTVSAEKLSVSPEMLEADGSVLMDAVAERDESKEHVGESPTKGGAVGLQEVDLDDLASSLDQDHKTEDVEDVRTLPNIA